MKIICKIFGSIVMMSMMLILTGCKSETPINVNFKAINCSADGENKPTAQASGLVNISSTITFTIIINGQDTIITTTKKSNELPVMAGNEVEIQFSPSCPEETEAFFTLPDGNTQELTASSPSFKWTIPDNFKSGMEIKGQSFYKSENTKYKATSKIILVPIEI